MAHRAARQTGRTQSPVRKQRVFFVSGGIYRLALKVYLIRKGNNGGYMADGVGLGPLNMANVQRASSDKSLGIKQAEKAFEVASQKAQDISIDRGVEVLLSERPRASVDPTYENLGSASRRNG